MPRIDLEDKDYNPFAPKNKIKEDLNRKVIEFAEIQINHLMIVVDNFKLLFSQQIDEINSLANPEEKQYFDRNKDQELI